MVQFSVGPDGDFRTIEEGLRYLETGVPDSVPVKLQLAAGVYRERVTVVRPYLTMEGALDGESIITGALYARMPSKDIGKLGTFRTYSVLIDTHDFTARNITFENAAGCGRNVGQALALYADGDRLFFENCRFLGGQDTLFTAPLPPKELEKHGFIGPGQFRPRTPGRHYYKNCYLEGDIDFVFGGAAAYFEQCEFFSRNQNLPVNSYVTAASTPEVQKYGYVMQSCRFTGDCPEHTAYLGRPWREYARTVLLDCEIGDHICEEGWHDWGKKDARSTVFYAEYRSSGPSGDMTKRPAWIHRLDEKTASEYTKEKVLAGKDGWNP